MDLGLTLSAVSSFKVGLGLDIFYTNSIWLVNTLVSKDGNEVDFLILHLHPRPVQQYQFSVPAPYLPQVEAGRGGEYLN